MFEEEYGIDVDVVAVGTGQSLKLGEDGNADVVLVHARAGRRLHGSRAWRPREAVMYNDFVIVGPPDDAASIAGGSDATAAFAQIAAAPEAPFVSRGDDSGTHVKEFEVWARPGVEPAGDWYVSAEQGMGAVLTASR